MSETKIPEKVRYLLWAKSAGRCEFDGCNKPLWRDGLTQIEMNFSDVAHIIGDQPKGPRGHAILSEKYRSDVNNIMLMCLDHHRMIDQIVKNYSEETLRKMKIQHEEQVEILTSLTPDKTSNVIIYQGRIGGKQPKIELRDAWLAMLPEWYPASHLPIELGFENSSFEDIEEEYWRIEETNLDRQFKEKVKPYLTSSNERNHFSVFAIAPQPLLIKLGALLTDLYSADIYQLHREPATWKWQSGPEKFDFIVKEPLTDQPIVVLKLAISATIDSNRIKQVLSGQSYSEWEITVSQPGNDLLKSKEQLQIFRQEFRKLLDKIKSKHGEKAIIHVFPAVPVSLAVEIGRIRQPKADLPFVVYDQNNKMGGFTQALMIGDVKND